MSGLNSCVSLLPCDSSNVVRALLLTIPAHYVSDLYRSGGFGVAAAAGGKAVQVEPMKPVLKAPGTKRLNPKYDKLLSNVAFKFNLRRYTAARGARTTWTAR